MTPSESTTSAFCVREKDREREIERRKGGSERQRERGKERERGTGESSISLQTILTSQTVLSHSNTLLISFTLWRETNQTKLPKWREMPLRHVCSPLSPRDTQAGQINWANNKWCDPAMLL